MQGLSLAEGIAGKGHRTAIGAVSGSPLERAASSKGLAVEPLPGTAIMRPSRLRRLLADTRWDILHLHDLDSLKAVRRIPFERASILSVSGDVRYGNRVMPGRLSLAGVTSFWAVSEWVWSALVRGGIDEERISVIHTAVDLERFTMSTDERRSTRSEVRPALGLGAADFVVGSVMSPAAAAGMSDLVEAVRMIRSGESPPGEDRVRLLVVGDGQGGRAVGSWKKLAARAGLQGEARFTGWREDVRDLMATMDVYVHPATGGSGFPVSLREAMALEIPVVATDLMGMREIIENGVHGLIAPVGDAAALARNILRMHRDGEFARTTAHKGRLKVKRYGVQAMVDRAEELYLRLIRTSGK